MTHRHENHFTLSAVGESDAGALLQACGLPHAWRECAAWTVLDAAFSDGTNFLTTWKLWKDDPLAPSMLHYVAITREAFNLACPTGLDAHASQLQAQYWGMLPGMHRLTFESGRVLLTLCVGELELMLREQQFEADCVYLGTHTWTQWRTKALARCCKRGTRTVGRAMDEAQQADMRQCGFALRQTGSLTTGHFDPPWPIKITRQPVRERPIEPRFGS